MPLIQLKKVVKALKARTAFTNAVSALNDAETKEYCRILVAQMDDPSKETSARKTP